jgi:hypothetical protein
MVIATSILAMESLKIQTAKAQRKYARERSSIHISSAILCELSGFVFLFLPNDYHLILKTTFATFIT